MDLQASSSFIIQCLVNELITGVEVEEGTSVSLKSSRTNGWHIFYRETCPKISEEAEMSSCSSDAWKTLTVEERERYNRLGQKEREDKDMGLAEPKTCKVCAKQFKRHNNLAFHEKNCGSCCSCEKCGKTFATKTALKRHEKRYTNDYTCNMCNKSLSTLQSLERHKATHAPYAKFDCKRCGITYSSKQSLVRHNKKVCGV